MANCHLTNQMTPMSWPRRRTPSLTSAKIGRTIVCAMLAWAVFDSVSFIAASSESNLNSDLVETETGWQFDDDIEPFDNATAPAPATATTKLPSNHIPLVNGDFESTNVTVNTTTLADISATTMIPNWLPGGAGVQIIQSPAYHMSSFAKSVFAIHLNNPASTANGTQGLIATTLATNPASGKSFTVQYDCARMPDGPINLLSALKVSSISGTTTNHFVFKKVHYNATDTATTITWQRQSFIYEGTGAATKIQFESMSEKYGPIIDNVVILSGQHALAAAPPAAHLALWQRVLPIFTVVTVLAFQCPQFILLL